MSTLFHRRARRKRAERNGKVRRDDARPALAPRRRDTCSSDLNRRLFLTINLTSMSNLTSTSRRMARRILRP
eukprot:CAMPEP_0180383574 /NCGR_PEP_ID=MMETSP0989-20121125/28033_1 /TAXON_ID=697907 /ORGANISM="non described non described, Strain CCMP2293" /LENGTH=71 /DNA_ID=CAMNT_0022383889 /DNA_START=44 /DNA_END=256 /DNA_ORIENTATION=+